MMQQYAITRKNQFISVNSESYMLSMAKPTNHLKVYLMHYGCIMK